MRRILFVLALLALLVSIQLHAVHGRAFSSTKTDGNMVVPGRSGEGGGDDKEVLMPVDVPSFADSANNPSSPKCKRMAFTLASGPSRKGPGH